MLLPIAYLHSAFDDFLPLVFLGLGRNHPITLDVLLDDLIHGGPGYTDSFGNVGDGHFDRLEVPILAEPQLNDPDFHGELHLGPLLQELVQVSDRQVDHARILYFQNIVI